MKYENLNELIRHSSSTRRFFLSLPIETQLALHEHNKYIHTAEELRRHAAAAKALSFITQQPPGIPR